MSMRVAIAASGVVVLLLVAGIAQQNNSPQAAKGTFASDSGEAQPLGTIAHQQQKPSTAAVKHVITNEEMPSRPAPPPEAKPRIQPKKPQPGTISDGKKPSDDGEDLLTAIRDEKDTIEEMQAALELMEAKVETWKGDDCRKYSSESGAYYDSCPEVTKLVSDRDRAKKNLEKEQAALAEMQEKARKAGFTSKQYDPD